MTDGHCTQVYKSQTLAQITYLQKAGWTRTEQVRMGIAVILWTKDGLTCNQQQALGIEMDKDVEKQGRMKLEETR